MPARILVIEDDPNSLELMTYLLTAFGHSAFSATDGEEGLQAVYREVPDLIVCDIQIPKVNGYQVAHRLKADTAFRAIPLIAATAFAMVGDRDKVMAAGFDGYITKPIEPETFVSQVEAFLPHEQASTPSPQVPRERVSEAQAPIAPDNHITILVVDNSPANLDLMQSTLEPFGYKVVTAGKVKEALALARQNPPDLFLSDLHMPVEDGHDFIRAVKADPQLRHIPFVFISSTVWREQDPQIGLSLGAARFLLRPIEPQELVAQIEACLRDRRK